MKNEPAAGGECMAERFGGAGLPTLPHFVGVEWYYGNVYETHDGVTPMNWWKALPNAH